MFFIMNSANTTKLGLAKEAQRILKGAPSTAEEMQEAVRKTNIPQEVFSKLAGIRNLAYEAGFIGDRDFSFEDPDGTQIENIKPPIISDALEVLDEALDAPELVEAYRKFKALYRDCIRLDIHRIKTQLACLVRNLPQTKEEAEKDKSSNPGKERKLNPAEQFEFFRGVFCQIRSWCWRYLVVLQERDPDGDKEEVESFSWLKIARGQEPRVNAILGELENGEDLIEKLDGFQRVYIECGGH